MNIRNLNNKAICILGFGREGKAVLEALKQYAPDADITIADGNANYQLPTTNCHSQVGDDYLRDLDRFDVIIKSPGIPPQPEFEAVAGKITNSTQLFLDSIDPKSMVIGITGSKGKSTTSTLLYEILEAAGKDTYLIGNIGEPAINYIERGKPNTIFVQEFSSFQLMDCTRSPHIAVVASFFPEHLDYHETIENYLDAKKSIARFQKDDDYVFYHRNFPECCTIAEMSPGRHIPFSQEDCPITLDEIHLLGDHNLGNVACAWMVARHLGIDDETIQQAVMAFRGLPHRLQSLGVHHGWEWVDDAISTTPESTIAGLDALGDRVMAVILGGLDRGLDFTELGERIAASNIELVVLFPESGARIREAIEAAGATCAFIEAESMQDAVEAIKNHPLPPNTHPISLLSTASPSYNMFKNFEEKGEAFKQCIQSTSS